MSNWRFGRSRIPGALHAEPCPDGAGRGTIRPMQTARPSIASAARARRAALLSYSIIASLAAAAGGCGGSDTRSVRPGAGPSSEAKPAGGALSVQLARTLPTDAAASAVVTFAVFRPTPLDDADAAVKAAEARVDKGFADPPTPLADFAEGRPPKPTIIAAPVDAALPLDLEALTADAGEAAPALEAARSVLFARYAGPPVDHTEHLEGAALAAALLAGPADAVVDLGTRRVWTGAGFAAWMTAKGWLADQVTVDAEQAEDGTVTFFTRGMARFGEPDLEATGVAPAEARERFAAFQALLGALRGRGATKPGDTVEGVVLRRCARPPEAIERTCVAM